GRPRHAAARGRAPAARPPARPRDPPISSRARGGGGGGARRGSGRPRELGPGITPLQAGLGWVVAWGKGGFRGHDALAAERERGVTRRLRGLEVEGRRPPRADYAVLAW